MTSDNSFCSSVSVLQPMRLLINLFIELSSDQITNHWPSLWLCKYAPSFLFGLDLLLFFHCQTHTKMVLIWQYNGIVTIYTCKYLWCLNKEIFHDLCVVRCVNRSTIVEWLLCVYDGKWNDRRIDRWLIYTHHTWQWCAMWFLWHTNRNRRQRTLWNCLPSNSLWATSNRCRFNIMAQSSIRQTHSIIAELPLNTHTTQNWISQ